MRFEFDPEKAVEAVLYLSARSGNDMYTTLKLLYLADKLHLERYGCLIFGDQYAALQYGPVPSNTYDILKSVLDGSESSSEVAPFSIERHSVNLTREADLDVFSRSDIQCLDEAIEKYGHLSFGELRNLVHDDAYNATSPNQLMRLETIASTLPNSAELIQHLSDPHPGSI